MYALGLIAAGLAVLGGRGAGVAALVVGIPGYLVLGYLFFATPYLVVVEDLALGDALARSYELAVASLTARFARRSRESRRDRRERLAGGDYFEFAWKYLAVVGVVSVAGTALVVNLGAAGVALGAVTAAPVGLALDAATLAFLADYDGS